MAQAIKLARADLTDDKPRTAAVISDVIPMSSYNWLDGAKNTPIIATPGAPPRWTPLKDTRQVKKDSGLIVINQNAYRNPTSPLEPLFRAVYAAKLSFDLDKVDLVTDRNNIRKLLSFIDWTCEGRSPESFSIDVEIVGHTALFCRAGTATYEIIQPYEHKGFGHEFEKAYTTQTLDGSTGHHRIISYMFGGLCVLLRYEVDGYHDGTQHAVNLPRAAQDSGDLSDMLGSLTLNPKHKNQTSDSTTKLTVKKAGQDVDMKHLIEIKTRTVNNRITINDVASQLWASQTFKLVRAHHYRGKFGPKDIKMEDVSDAIKKWEQDNQRHLQKLVILIKKIIDAAKSCGGQGVVRYDAGTDTLSVCKVERARMLPEDLYERWRVNKKAELYKCRTASDGT